ncbi:MAG: HDIG domain-containing protein [Muribaculaceae bacterium]|nr:HDIG domain-containing protein [Muribaculaceae bacterium]
MTDKKHNYLIIAMFVAATVIISLMLPRHDKVTALSYEQGKPWMGQALYAPFDIPIELSKEAEKAIIDSVTKNFIPIYKRDEKVTNDQIALLEKEVSSHYEIPAHVKQGIINTVNDAYSSGIVDNSTNDEIQKQRRPTIRIFNPNGEVNITSTEGMKSVKQVYELLDSLYGSAPGNILETTHVSTFLQPNVVIDTETNDKYFQDARNNALAPTGMIQTSELIINTGEPVTAQKFTNIQTMERMLQEREQNNNRNEDLSFLGKIMLVTIIILMFCIFITSLRYRVYGNLKSMVFLISFMTLFICAVFAVVRFRANYLYLIPFAFVPIVINSFFDVRISFFTHIVVVLICSLAAKEQAQFIIMQFLAGCIAIACMIELTRRSQLLKCAIYIFLAYSATHVAMLLSRGVEFNGIDWHYLSYYAVNCVALSFAYVGIFVIEKIFGYTSVVTLIELSDINTPVLRRLAERCPGTFQHSLQVANIASEAAIKVGASQQLVRAGALYHDIGKTENPAFFTENQNGVNPHDGLDPEQSASIVIEHVAAGKKIAEKARLPKEITDLIVQHHGTSITRYFYTQACKAAGDTQVDAAPYTYSGPRPQSKEAAILMMADACEAATKSLTEPTEKNITALVEKIVNSQIASGELKDAPISLMHIEVVKKVFIERLKALYYTRISYPDDIKPATSADDDTPQGVNE